MKNSKQNVETKENEIQDTLSCGCGHCENERSKGKTGENLFDIIKEKKFDILKITFGLILLLCALFTHFDNTVKSVLCLIAVLVLGYELLIKCVKDIFKLNFFDENTLMVIASSVSFVLGDYYESVLIVLLYSIGELLEDIATDNSKNKIAGLKDLKVSVVRLATDKGVEEVSPESVEVGSLIEIRKGDVVAIDGKILTDCIFDMKAVTGESKIFELAPLDDVYSGAVNLGDAVIIKTTKLYKDSTVEKIISTVEGANAKKAKSQNFITSFAKIYTPVVVMLAVLIAVFPPLIIKDGFDVWIYKALSFLVISCPCALVISVPLAFFIGIGSLAKKGVLVKGSKYIDDLSQTKSVLFDKTGTITKGRFVVDKVNANNGYSENYIIKISASLEKYSSHPIAKAVLNYYKGEYFDISDIKEYSGKGVYAIVQEKEVLVGNMKLLSENGVPLIDVKTEEIALFVSIDGEYAGKIEFKDGVKNESLSIVSELKKVGVGYTAIISGDKESVCEKIGDAVGVVDVFAEMLPEDKSLKVEEIKKKSNGKTVYVGDGINDSPSLAVADVGIAMGGLGSDIAIESANVVIMDDNLLKVPFAIKKSKKIKRKIIQNIACSIGIKVAVMVLSIVISLPVWIAMFADVGVMLLAVCNSLTLGN